MIMDD